jgi:prepilin-type N-terminal cleavage/methylation domain-containing protein
MLKSMLTRLRETSMRESEGEEAAEAGFTLIELMVVLLIIAILLAIAIPTFLGVANSAGDRAAQSNLTNALTEAKAIYQNSAAYSSTVGTTVTVLPVGTFIGSAPEFKWVQGSGVATGGCSAGASGNCISEQVVDVGAVTDSQGLILATFSPKTSSCWYALDLETTPSVIASDPGYVAFNTGTASPTGATTAGVFYAQKKTGVTGVNCNALYPTTVAFNWGQSYSAPGTAG